MKKTGEILKKAREEKKLSLHEIGLSLKISSKVLRSIEEGDEKHLPAKTFLRGFVQSYANFLGLEVDKVLDVFYEEMGSTRPKPYIRPADNRPLAPSNSTPKDEVLEKKPEPELAPRHSLGHAKDVQALEQKKSKKTVAVFVVVAAIVGLIIFTKKMVDKYSKEAQVPREGVAQTIEGATPLTLEATPMTEAIDSEKTAPMSVDKGSDNNGISTSASPAPGSSALAPISTPAPIASPSPAVVAKPLPTPTPSVAASASPAPSPSPTQTPTLAPTPSATPETGRPVELIVEALDAVEIEYSAPNSKNQKIRLSPEQVHTFKSRSGLSISFSNGGAVNLILNGKDLGIPGDLGKPIKLSY
jgi:cytoskeleton protein RodZ